MLKIITDSASDLTEDLLKKFDIQLLSFYVSLDSINYFKERVEIALDDFYEKVVREHIFPKTSLVPSVDYLREFEQNALQGNETLCLTLSARLSGAYQSALTAKDLLLEKYPRAVIEVLDSDQATGGSGLIAMEAARMRNAGMTLSQIVGKVKSLRDSAAVIFTSDSLEFLQKGGRIGLATALVGSILSIKPILVFEKGELYPRDKVRGRKKSIARLVELAKEKIGKNLEDYDFAIMNGYNTEDGKELENQMIQQGFNVKYPNLRCGAVIITHTGPTVLGLAYSKRFELV